MISMNFSRARRSRDATVPAGNALSGNNVVVDVNGKYTPRSPKAEINAYYEHGFHLGGGTLSVRGDFGHYQGAMGLEQAATAQRRGIESRIAGPQRIAPARHEIVAVARRQFERIASRWCEPWQGCRGGRVASIRAFSVCLPRRLCIG